MPTTCLSHDKRLSCTRNPAGDHYATRARRERPHEGRRDINRRRLTSLSPSKYLSTVPFTRWDTRATGSELITSNKNHPFKYLFRGNVIETAVAGRAWEDNLAAGKGVWKTPS